MMLELTSFFDVNFIECENFMEYKNFIKRKMFED